MLDRFLKEKRKEEHFTGLDSDNGVPDKDAAKGKL